MEADQSIFKHQSLKVEVRTSADEEMLGHFKATVLGTPGGLQYKHTTIESKLNNLGKVYFLLLKRYDHLLGTVGLALRDTYVEGKKCKSWYIRYFAIRAPMQAKTQHGKKKSKNPDRGNRLLLSVGKAYFENPDLFENSEAKESTQSIIYSYTEKENFRTLGFNDQMELSPVRSFNTLLFSRFRTKEHANISIIIEKEIAEVKNLITDFYRNYTMFSWQNLFFDHRFLLYKQDGKIVAGLQANPDLWEIHGLGGRKGKFLLKVLPLIPGLKRIFKPDSLKFLAVEGLFYLPGYECCIQPLLETACAKFDTNLIMMWFDANSQIITDLDRTTDYGFISKIMKRVEADVRVRFINFSEEEMEKYKSRPAYISAFDMT
jgi:hypothetical protein